MRPLVLLIGLIPFSSFAQTVNSDCSSVDGSTPELSTKCVPGATTNCSVDTVYKVTQSTGSSGSLLPPITITSSGAICILNNAVASAQKPVNIFAQSIWVKGGLFQIGTIESPITSKNKVTITMGGSKGVSPAPQPLCASDQSSCSEIAKNSIATNNYRDITVTGGGKLLMYGAKGLTKLHSSDSYIHNVSYDNKTVDNLPINLTNNDGTSGDINQVPYFNNLSGSNSWTYLINPAGPSYFNANMGVQAPVDVTSLTFKEDSISSPTKEDAPYILVLSRNVTDDTSAAWESGDWISVATTSFVSHETEIVQICDIYNTKNPDGELPSKAFEAYSDAVGETQHQNVSVVVLAGAPSYKSKCPNITNDTPLKHYHFGSLTPTPGFFGSDQTYTNQAGQQYNVSKGQAYSMYDPSNRNYGIDERAEVALLSRNIKLTSMAGSPSTPKVSNIDDQYFGGNIAVMNCADASAPAANVALVGVEIEKFGQPLVGRYPVHFHRLNSESTMIDHNLLVQDSSVHHSYNKCYVTHDTMGAKFYNNSCVRTIGQGFYLEDGHNIADNQYIRNLVSGVMAAALNYDPSVAKIVDQGGNTIGFNTYWDGDYLSSLGGLNYNPAKVPDTSDSGANTGNYFDSTGPSGFWITTFGGYSSDDMMPNAFVNNSVAGCQLRGVAYWLVRQDVNNISNVPSTVEADLYPIFTGNRGHACYDGVMAGLNFAETGTAQPAAVPPKPVVIGNSIDTSSNAPLIIFDSLTLTQIQQKAFWYRGAFVALTNGRFSGLKQGMTLLGGGGPEGNLLGFWGLVHNSVFAGITNNTVSRYVDCEKYYQAVGTGQLTLSDNDALQVATLNEMAQCVPFVPSGGSLTVSVSPISPNDMSVFGDLRPNFNFQGYTFYDGPARMEDNRFINFRADPTDTTLIEEINGETTRSLVTKVDAHRMLNYNMVSQLSNGVGYTFTPGGQNYFGYNGDAAFSWLKGNAQSVPPTQYALGNIWENTNFKHQVFTEIVNLSSPLGDGDKQTVEIDRDTTLSGYYVCETKDNTKCSNNGQLNHYPISLNNLDIFSTKHTVDEPESRGRNNVIDGALMSPNKYATVNIGFANQSGLPAGTNLALQRDMQYQSKYPNTSLTGRGGLKYMYEAMVMNNMAYSYGKEIVSNALGSYNLLVSYSDAPVDSLFINRVGVCIGPNADDTKIKIVKTPRQWNSGVSYLTASPYFGNQIKDTTNTCPSVVSDAQAFSKCQSTGEDLSKDGWGKVSAYTASDDLNNEFLKGIKANYDNTAITAGGLTEGYYYDKDSGMLYFNMIQYPQQSAYSSNVTPPYGTCDDSQYTTQVSAITNYLTYSNSDNIKSVLEKGCYIENSQPQTSELLTCPKEGCPVYTVEYSAGTGSCTQPGWAKVNDVSPAAEPSIDTTTKEVNYSSPYALYNVTGNSQLSLTPYSVTVNGTTGSTEIRDFNYITGSGSVSESSALLPLSSPVYVSGVTTVNMSTTPDITILPYPTPNPTPTPAPTPSGTKWTLNMGVDDSGDSKTATLAVNGVPKLKNGTSPYTESSSVSISNSNPSTTFYYSGSSATLSYGSVTDCIITFSGSSYTKSASCTSLGGGGTTMSLPPPSAWPSN